MKTVINKNGSPASFLVDYSVDRTFNCSDALSTWGGRKLYRSTQTWGLRHRMEREGAVKSGLAQFEDNLKNWATCQTFSTKAWRMAIEKLVL